MLVCSRSKRLITLLLLGHLVLPCGCDVLTLRRADFPNAETGDQGEIYLLEDLQAIANDPDLNDGEKREAFRELGIEDADLIEALLGLEVEVVVVPTG